MESSVIQDLCQGVLYKAQRKDSVLTDFSASAGVNTVISWSSKSPASNNYYNRSTMSEQKRLKRSLLYDALYPSPQTPFPPVLLTIPI